MRPPKEKVASNVRCKGMVGTGQVASREQGQPPTRCYLLMRSLPVECSSSAR